MNENQLKQLLAAADRLVDIGELRSIDVGLLDRVAHRRSRLRLGLAVTVATVGLILLIPWMKPADLPVMETSAQKVAGDSGDERHLESVTKLLKESAAMRRKIEVELAEIRKSRLAYRGSLQESTFSNLALAEVLFDRGQVEAARNELATVCELFPHSVGAAIAADRLAATSELENESNGNELNKLSKEEA